MMSKRYKAIAAKVDRNKLYPLSDALNLVKENAGAKFDESIDVAINLGIDAKKSDQLVRGSVVFAQGNRQDSSRRGFCTRCQSRRSQGCRC